MTYSYFVCQHWVVCLFYSFYFKFYSLCFSRHSSKTSMIQQLADSRSIFLLSYQQKMIRYCNCVICDISETSTSVLVFFCNTYFRDLYRCYRSWQAILFHQFAHVLVYGRSWRKAPWLCSQFGWSSLALLFLRQCSSRPVSSLGGVLHYLDL